MAELLCCNCHTPTDESELVFHPSKDYEPWCEDCYDKKYAKPPLGMMMIDDIPTKWSNNA